VPPPSPSSPGFSPPGANGCEPSGRTTSRKAGWGATNASTVTYLTPLVGVVAGAVVLGEHVRWNQPAGALVVLLGIVISQDRLPALLTRAHLLRSRSPTATPKPAAEARGGTGSADPADSYVI
jgi:hypothetical protein